MIVLQKPSTPLLAANRRQHRGPSFVLLGGEQQEVVLSLMVPLRMVMCRELLESSPERAFSKESTVTGTPASPSVPISRHMRSGSDSALATAQAFYFGHGQRLLERSTELRVPVVQNVPASVQMAPRVQSGVTGYLLHPLSSRVLGHTADSDLAAVQVEEEQHIPSYQPAPGQHLNRKEVGSRQHCPVTMDESRSRWWSDSVSVQERCHAAAECCPPSGPTPGVLNCPGLLRSGRTPIQSSLAPVSLW